MLATYKAAAIFRHDAKGAIYDITDCAHNKGELEVRKGRFRINDQWFYDENVHDDGRGVTCLWCGKRMR